MSEHCRTSTSDPQRRVSFFERDPGIPVVSATPPSNDMTTARPEPSNSTTEEWDEYEEPNRKGFLGLVDKFSPQMVLENSGSVGEYKTCFQVKRQLTPDRLLQARDHLANERTWLAYVRTSLAIASTGVGTCIQVVNPKYEFTQSALSFGPAFYHCCTTAGWNCTHRRQTPTIRTTARCCHCCYWNVGAGAR
jgi:hypothetical protein